jgi:hypothetical protein
VDELVDLALRTGEPQRVVPTAEVAGAFAATVGDHALLARVTDAVLGMSEQRWVANFSVAPLCRALSRAGDLDRLVSLIDMLERLAAVPRAPRGHHRISLAAGRGLRALHEGEAGLARDELEVAVTLERELGRSLHVACLGLDLAVALERAGERERGEERRRESQATLASYGCVQAL